MNWEGHIGIAVILYLPLGFTLLVTGVPGVALAGGIVVVVAAVLPNVSYHIDHMDDRGFTHSVWFLLLVTVGLGLLGAGIGMTNGILWTIGLGLFGFVLGLLTLLTHLAVDIVTGDGIRPYNPVYDKEYEFAVVEQGERRAKLTNHGLFAVAILGTLVSIYYGI
jgi:inner membrane protein